MQTIERLNNEVWATIGVSSISGVGVIAIRDIPKGQKIYATSDDCEWLCAPNLDGLLPEIRHIIKQRWPYAPQGFFLSPNDDARLVSFMNHGEPNYDPKTDCALKDIHRGEEIFEQYPPELVVGFQHG